MAPPISTAIAIDLSRFRQQSMLQLAARGNSDPLGELASVIRVSGIVTSALMNSNLKPLRR